MIELYTWPTPNGHKVHIMLEETGLKYEVHPIDIQRGDQFNPEYLKINPNNKMPTIVDTEGPGGKRYPVFESGAILMYLAEKTGKFMPKDMAGKYEVIQWLMFQMGGIGPMLGQAHHFRGYAPEKIQYAIDRYTNEAGRLYRVVNKRLSDHEYIAGEYSIADMAIYPWLQGYERQGQKLEDYPHIARWFKAVGGRPAVQRGMQVLADRRRTGPMDDKAKEMMFGKTQYAAR